MKSKVSGSTKPEFPKLMVSKKGTVVLFTKLGAGCVVGFTEGADESEYTLGQYSATWATFNFEPFEGEVTLSNV